MPCDRSLIRRFRRPASPGRCRGIVISQSGAIVAGMIEWAAQRAIGFSAVISVSDQVDVDFGDLLDPFAANGATRAIVLYVESIKDARKFMSAARATARTKTWTRLNGHIPRLPAQRNDDRPAAFPPP
jgi:acyl-CoA synthetase (NDP forming)